MNRFPRTTLPLSLFFGGLVVYGVLVWMSGSDTTAPRGPAIDTAALLTVWAMVVAVVIGVTRVFRDIADSEEDLPWNVVTPAAPQQNTEPLRNAA